jgi:hypothetical protein
MAKGATELGETARLFLLLRWWRHARQLVDLLPNTQAVSQFDINGICRLQTWGTIEHSRVSVFVC